VHTVELKSMSLLEIMQQSVVVVFLGCTADIRK